MDTRLLRKINKTNTCWLWLGAHTNNGYGTLIRDGKNQMAHRYVYKQLMGAIPPGLTLDHGCEVKLCVNPAHLKPMTMQANILKSNNMAARNAKKTHCPHGHKLKPRKDIPKWRYCPVCKANKQRERNFKVRA